MYRLLVLLISIIATVSASPIKEGRAWTYGECNNKTIGFDFDFDKFISNTWYEISKLQNNFENDTSCVKLDFFLTGTDLTLAFSAQYKNLTSGSFTSTGTLELTGEETNIQMNFPGDDEPMKLTILETDFDNYAIIYSCKQLSMAVIPTKEERAWVLSRKHYFEEPYKTIINELTQIYNLYYFLYDTNQNCKPDCCLFGDC